MKWLKRIGLVFAALLLLVAVALWWLLDTGVGLRFALARAQGMTHGALSVQQAQGRLLGPLQLAGVRYDDGAGLVVQVAQARLDLRLGALLYRRLHVLSLDADGIRVALPAPSPASSSSSSFSLKPPLALVLDRVHVGSVQITRGDQPLFVSNRLDLAGRWTNAGIDITRLALDAPDGHATLDGRLALGRRQRGDGRAAFAWKLGATDLAGTLAARSDGRNAHAELTLTQPLAARLQLDLDQRGSDAWTATLDAPRFDPQPLLGASAPASMALALQGHGDRHAGTLQGRIDLDAYTVLLQPLVARLGDDDKTLTLQQLVLGSPQIPGRVTANGTLQLDASPLRGEFAVQWQDLQLPAALVGQPLASHGRLNARGSTEQFHADGDVALGPPGQLAKLALDLDGTPRQITLHTLQLKQPQGGLDARGTLTLQPALAWQLDASGNRFDPGQLFSGWNGALDFTLRSAGRLARTGPDATLELQKLGGSLRGRAVSGGGTLHLSPARVLDGRLALQSGGSTVRIDAPPGERNDLDLQLAVASLGDWLPNAGGHLDGAFRIGGRWPQLSVNGHLQGQSLQWQQQQIDQLQLIAGVPDLRRLAGKLELRSGGVHAGGLVFQHVNLLAEGSEGDHRLTLDARGEQLSAALALHGALKGNAWNGTLSTLTLEPQGLPGWRLQRAAQLGWRDGAMSLPELCLAAGEPRLCVTAKQDKAGNLDASYRLHALPLALLANAGGFTNAPLRADGTLDGNGQLRRSAAGMLNGNATLDSVRGSLTDVDHPEQPLLSYRNLALHAALTPSSLHLTAQANLDDNGRLDGQITISGKQQALAGQLDLQLNRLDALALFTNQVAAMKGRLNASLRIAGTLAQPALGGHATLDGFAAEIPDAGLKLDQGRLLVSSLPTDGSGAQTFRLDGSVRSGEGTLTIGGVAGFGTGATTAITLKGSAFTAANIPAAKVVVSPDLLVQQNANGLDVSGGVAIDSADVDVAKLPGGGASKASPDVVIVDQPQAPANASALPITATVKVDLGGKTHVIGEGLDGRLGGVLTVSERPGRATTGQGQVTVSGSYKAYGQSLHIDQGQLLFASTPIDNPGLNIRALRKLNPNATIDEGQQVGLLITGTAKRPVLTVFSNPVMEQSDALSYLVTGKPLSQAKGGEGDMVNAAAQALGSAAGNLLAKSVGAKIGVDDIGVSSNAALGGNSAFTVGKYLSPRLYLSYGVGLFEPGQVITLRYRLSHRWNFEAQNATDFSRASFNYRYER